MTETQLFSIVRHIQQGTEMTIEELMAKIDGEGLSWSIEHCIWQGEKSTPYDAEIALPELSIEETYKRSYKQAEASHKAGLSFKESMWEMDRLSREERRGKNWLASGSTPLEALQNAYDKYRAVVDKN